MRKTIISHDNCTDGMGSVFAFYLKYKDDIDYIKINHNKEKFKGLDINLFKDQTVWMVDMCLNRNDLLELALKTNNKLIVLDHHLSAKEECGDLDFCYFDMNKSGAVLAYEYCFPGTEVPMLFKHIEDRDLYKFKLEKSKEFLATLDSIPKKFEDWMDFYNKSLDPKGYDEIINIGKNILQSEFSRKESIKKYAYKINTKGFEDIPIINSNVFLSDILNQLCQSSPFAIGYYFDGNKYIVSVRSVDNGYNYTALQYAKLFGGGGHKHAAGFILKDIKDLEQ